jgi:hypothetical protein
MRGVGLVCMWEQHATRRNSYQAHPMCQPIQHFYSQQEHHWDHGPEKPKKLAKFTFVGCEVRSVTNPFKCTTVGIAFITIHNIEPLLSPVHLRQQSHKYSKSRAYALTCNHCQKLYIYHHTRHTALNTQLATAHTIQLPKNRQWFSTLNQEQFICIASANKKTVNNNPHTYTMQPSPNWTRDTTPLDNRASASPRSSIGHSNFYSSSPLCPCRTHLSSSPMHRAPTPARFTGTTNTCSYDHQQQGDTMSLQIPLPIVTLQNFLTYF